MRATKKNTKKTALGLLMATLMGAPAPVAFAEGDEHDGQWLNSRCRAARVAFAVEQKQLQGFVKVKYDIQANGRVTNIRVVESDPPGVMDRSVKNAIRGWRYFAYFKDGVESGRKDVEMTFTFGGSAEAKEASCTHMPWSETTTAQAK
ncbi:MAG: TonB family protein [Alphaproteobacteria bacterium]|nr:TonB family protein [Alphaproteobacteria bacterium]